MPLRPTLAALMLLAACSSPERTARRDLEAAERALTGLPAGAIDVIPEQVATLNEALRVGRQAFETGDYGAASTSLSAIPAQASQLADSIPARRAALQAEMDTLAIVVPRNIAAIETELDRIGRTGRFPAGLDRAGLREVRQIRDSATIMWSEVKRQFDAGKLADAMAIAHDLKARVSRALLALGLVADERAWSNVTLPTDRR